MYYNLYLYLNLCLYIYIYITISISIVIVCDHEITHTSYAISGDKIYIYIYIYKNICIKFHGPFFVYGVQLPQGSTKPLWGDDSLLFTRSSWYSLDQYRKDERLRWPWSHPVVLNLCMNLVSTKYKLKSQFKLTQLWPLTLNCFEVSS